MGKTESKILEDNLQQIVLTNSEVKSNLGENIFISTEDKIKICLMDYLKDLGEKKSWITPLGLFVTIAITFSTTEFKDSFGLPKETWQAVFFIAGIMILFWFFYTVGNAGKTKTVDEVIEELKKSRIKEFKSSASSDTLRVINAIYGTPPNKIADVTDTLNSKIVDNKLSFHVGNNLVPKDPDEGVRKTLDIKYSMENNETIARYNEYEDVTLP